MAGRQGKGNSRLEEFSTHRAQTRSCEVQAIDTLWTSRWNTRQRTGQTWLTTDQFPRPGRRLGVRSMLLARATPGAASGGHRWHAELQPITLSGRLVRLRVERQLGRDNTQGTEEHSPTPPIPGVRNGRLGPDQSGGCLRSKAVVPASSIRNSLTSPSPPHHDSSRSDRA